MLNWYKNLKVAQFVNFQAIVQSIYQRLVQADRGAPAAENAADDILSQGFAPPQIENAINQAIAKLLGPNGNETQLSEPQRHVIYTLRGVPPPQAEIGVDAGQSQQSPVNSEQGLDSV